MSSTAWFWMFWVAAAFFALLGAARADLRKLAGLGFLGFVVFWVMVGASFRIQ